MDKRYVAGAPRIKNDRYVATSVLHVPPFEGPDSKRALAIEQQRGALDTELVVLDTATKERNRILKAELEALWTRCEAWAQQLRAEKQRSRAALDALRAHFDDSLLAMSSAEDASLMDTMRVFHMDIPKDEARLTAIDDDAREFVDTTVPAVIDRQSGIVERKLAQAVDTFDIDNAKIRQREQKIVARFATHAKRTAQAFEDERATRVSKTRAIEDDVAAIERTDDHQEERATAAAHNALTDLRTKVANEQATRQKHDNALLDSMIYAQNKLQHSVLAAFGNKPPTAR